MLAFFRRIRKSLITNNSAKKYFLYAIGEILLVVIGILIAINLNNNNQNSITKKERDEKIIKLRNDIYGDSIGLAGTINFNRANILKIDSLLILLNSNMSLDTYNHFRAGFIESNMNFRTTFPTQSVYNELISSGDFSKIEVEELKERISSYYLLFNHFNELINQFLNPLLISEKKIFNEGLLAHKFFQRNNLNLDIEQGYVEFKAVLNDPLKTRILENHFYELRDMHNQITYFYSVIVNEMIIGLPLKPENQ